MLLTQDEGDPGTSPLGYVTLELPDVPDGTHSLRLENRFVRSSFEDVDEIGFAVSRIGLTEEPL